MLAIPPMKPPNPKPKIARKKNVTAHRIWKYAIGCFFEKPSTSFVNDSLFFVPSKMVVQAATMLDFNA
jgi:hypothetical protein